MKNRTAASLLFLFAFMPFLTRSQPLSGNPPKREFRGVWIASVINIDYPAAPTMNSEDLKREWMNTLNFYKGLNFNAILMQIRPSSDALYPSQLAPWSRYLTGQQGTPPSGGFDPLAYMIETTHAAGMEFHAWMNPYRASMDNEQPSQMHDLHILKQHPDWCLKYNKRWIMNPGLPDVREHVTQVVEEVVRNYDIDAIHFDDYFYPYKNGSETFNDLNTFAEHQNGFSNLEDWRRNNVDMLIEQVARRIKAIKPRVQFGISPFGIWRNMKRDPNGSETNGTSCYDDLFADVRKWLQNGWIDYVVPQLYWTIGFSIADHATLANWWSNNSFGKNVYIGHGYYRIGSGGTREPNWNDSNEIPRQIALSRSLKNVKGSVYFSSKNLMRNPLGVTDLLRNDWYAYPAFPPVVIPDTSKLVCESPALRRIEAKGDGSVLIRWEAAKRDCLKQPFQYVVYRFDGNQVNFENGRNILATISGDAKNLEFNDKTAVDGYIYTYSVSIVDCHHNEKVATDVQTVQKVVDEKGKAEMRKLQGVDYPVGLKPKRKSWWRRLFGL
ncbi:MAG: hypothetical protein RL757_3238 [Bacteroidota bacterium]|jgi:uncharacterized lipoprotein YddW (UPF0748 family)